MATLTEGYSCSDLVSLCKEASFGPLRELGDEEIIKIKQEDIRPISMADFLSALKVVRPTVSARERERWKEQKDRLLG